jgi:UDP:flavonoid glycosyltransferase YjiC (YdhE family)
MTARLLTTAAAACEGASAIVAGLSSLWAGSMAEAAGLPVIWAFLQPLTPTRAFASSVWPMRHSRAFASRASYVAVDAASWWPWRGVVNRWRRTNGLPALGARGILHLLHQREDAILNGFSRHLVSAPADWPAACAPVGFWFAETQAGLDAATEKFLAAADDVVYFGTGAGSATDPRALLALAHDVLLRLNVRAVVNVHGVDYVPDAFRPRMHLVRDLPHAALFPRLRAVVHHGGAGTTAEVARAGVPAVVLPVFADQFFWAERAHAAGVASAPIPQRRLSRSVLAGALQGAIEHAPMRSNARALAERIRGEDGITSAVAAISAVLARAEGAHRDRQR